MYKLLNTIVTPLFLLFISGLSPLLADEWVLKSDGYSLSRTFLEQTLKVRGFSAEPLSAEQQQALLRELFIRENLLLQQNKVPPAALAEFNDKLQEYRRNQLARLTLDSLAEQGMPDFSRRAKELYDARKHDQYQLPLRLRVRILRQSLPAPPSNIQQTAEHAADKSNIKLNTKLNIKQRKKAKIAELQALLTRLSAGELDFQQAVMQHSDDPRRTLHGGDSFWFERGQKAAVIFNAAEALNTEQPLSGVLVHDNHAYILKFMGRQEPMQQAFATVKDTIVTELQAEYRNEQRKLLLTQLRDRFQNNTEIHPDFQ